MLRAVRMVGRQQQVAETAALVAGKAAPQGPAKLVELTLVAPPKPPA